MRTPSLPDDLPEATKAAFNEILKRVVEYDAEVMAVHDTGTTAGMVEVFVQELYLSSNSTDTKAWRNAFPHGLYEHRTPDVGDMIKVKYKNFLDDDLIYLAHSYQQSRAQTGAGQKVLFEYSYNGDLYSMYFDKSLPGIIAKAGGTTIKIKDGTSLAYELKVGSDQTIVIDATGNKITLTQGSKVIEMSAAGVSITGNTSITGDLDVTGNISATGNGSFGGTLTSTGNATIAGISIEQLKTDFDALRAEYDAHGHDYISPTGPGVTGTPIPA